jgi:hypothetical protein
MFYKNPQGKPLYHIMCGITPWGGKYHTMTLLNFSRLSEMLQGNGNLYYTDQEQ